MSVSKHPIPDEKAKPCFRPFEIRDISLEASRVGFLLRAYSYPLWTPSAPAVGRGLMDRGMMVPVVGSGPLARVDGAGGEAAADVVWEDLGHV